MAVSLPASRVRELVRLLGEVWEIAGSGADATRHAAEALLSVVGADVGGFVLAPNPSVARGDGMIRASLAGFSPGEQREVADFYQRMAAPVDGAANALIAVDPSGTGVCRRRRDLVGDDDWYRSAFVTDYRKRWAIDDSIYGGLKSATGNYAGLGCFRAWGGRPFSEEDRELAQAFADGCKGVLFAGEHSIALSPRLEETLEHLLSGDSAKQMAAKMGLSVHTVNEYIQAVYRAHGVTTRAELLLRVLRRPPKQ